jgi:outer membrane protein OmpA-like peptidoglycan-associated protein
VTCLPIYFTNLSLASSPRPRYDRVRGGNFMRLFLLSFLVFFSFTTQANVVGTHLQNFNPTTNGLDFVTVQSTKTLAPGEFNLGFWTNYAFNSLPFFKAPGVPSAQSFSEPNDKLLSADFNIGLGLTDFWDIGLSLPAVLDQSIDESLQLGSYNDTGLTEIRLNSKYRFFQKEDWALAAVASVNFDRIKNNPFSGNDSGPSWNLEGVFDYVIEPGLLWAVNIGYRWHDAGQAIPDSDVTPLSDQIIYSSALSYFYERWNTHLIFEVFGSSFVENTPLATDRKRSNLELLAGAKYQMTPKLSAHGGVTTEGYHGLASPDFRIYFGLNWLVGPIEPRPIIEPVAQPIQQPVAAPQMVVVEEPPSEVIVLSSINFDTKSDEMTGASRRDFQATIDRIKNNSQVLRKIIVEGHTDSRGTDAYNLGLSLRRANSVSRVLKSELPSAVVVEGVGKGESRPVDRNDTETGRAANRRVELKIYRAQ